MRQQCVVVRHHSCDGVEQDGEVNSHPLELWAGHVELTAMTDGGPVVGLVGWLDSATGGFPVVGLAD